MKSRKVNWSYPKPTGKHWSYHFYHNKKIEWWMERCVMDKNILGIVLPNAIRDITNHNLISENESTSLRNMLLSKDDENWYIAIRIIINYKKQIKKQK